MSARGITRFALVGIIAFTPCVAVAQVAASEPKVPPAHAEAAASVNERENPATPAPPAPEDGWPDISEFLDKKYGFLPIVMPITEPAVGYGAAGGLAFVSSPLGTARAGLGRPNVTFAGGMGTANGSWGVAGGDMRYWLHDHLQTLAGLVYASVNLDFHGIGKTDALVNNPLRYNLEPKGALGQAKYRFGDSLVWAGLRYMFSSTEVAFDAPDTTPNLPDYDGTSRMAGLTALGAFDNRNNIFTPTQGTFVEATFGVFAPWLGGDDSFERVDLAAIQYLTLPQRIYLGVRGDVSATFADAPFYARPFIDLRGVPMMRYQGEEMAELEFEIRWQFWKRLSAVGFVGGGGAWTQLERFDSAQGVASGGGGVRYELARNYGLHAGADLAFSRDTTAFYIQVGSAWMRP